MFVPYHVGSLQALHHGCKSDKYDVVKFLVEEMKANTEAEDDVSEQKA